MNKGLILAAFLFFSISKPALSQEQIIKGNTWNCSDIVKIDKALQLPDESFFYQWTDDDFQSGLNLINACPNSGWTNYFNNRLSLFNKYWGIAKQAASISAWNAEQERLQREKEAEKVARAKKAKDDLAASEQAKRDRKLALDACEGTSSYRLFDYQEKVINDLELIAGVVEQQKKEREIAAYSGVRNLWNERANGELLYQGKRDLENDFIEYKRLGGKAKSARNVKKDFQDPCISFR